MTVEEMNIYKMRISQAGIAELTVVMLEMEIQWIKEALDFYGNSDMDSFLETVTKAQSTQVELMNVMNMDNAVAVDVYSVFAFVNRQLIEAKIKRQALDLLKCKGMLERLHKSFQKIVPTDTAGPVMMQSEKVYAGLTYGSGGLVENSVGGKEYTV